MAGTIKSNVQLGDSATAASNFTLTAAAADGTLKLARGNAGATTQDILTVDPAGVMSAIGNKVIYNRGNVVGTVAQAAGAPTGAVVERGSNANGEYVRWADGTQICTTSISKVLTPNTATGYPITYAASFVAIPTLSASVSAAGATLAYVGGLEGTTVTGTGYFVGASAGAPATNTITVHFIAIGRWF